jgi:hypothetical protein
MKPIEMVQMIKQSKPELIGKLPDKRAAAVIRASLTLLRDKIDALDEGVIKLPGFGRFAVRQVVRKKGDEEVTVKQVVFLTDKPKTN